MESNDTAPVTNSCENLEQTPELVTEKPTEPENGPHTPGDKEEEKKIDSPVESPPILEKAEDAEICGSDESTTALASADEGHEQDQVENHDLVDETLTTIPGGEEKQTDDNLKEAVKRKANDAGDEQEAKRPVEEKDDDDDIQEIGETGSPLAKEDVKPDEDDVVLLHDEADDSKFKAPELPKEKGSNGKCKSAGDCE